MRFCTQNDKYKNSGSFISIRINRKISRITSFYSTTAYSFCSANTLRYEISFLFWSCIDNVLLNRRHKFYGSTKDKATANWYIISVKSSSRNIHKKCQVPSTIWKWFSTFLTTTTEPLHRFRLSLYSLHSSILPLKENACLIHLYRNLN